MYRKHKARTKKISTKFIIFVFILILILIGSGYSLYTSKLYINGNVTLKYKEPKLENLEIVESNGQQLTLSASGSILAYISPASIKSSSKFDNDTFGVSATITNGWGTQKVTLTMTFTNKNASSLTNGKIEIAENSGLTASSQTADATVASQSNGNVTVVLSSISSSTSGTIKYRISYEIDGAVKYMYLTITK